MKPKNEIKYIIGDKVTIYATVQFFYDNSVRRVMHRNELEIPQVGVITGASYKPLGILESESIVEEGMYPYTIKYLDVTSTVFVYTIKYGMLNSDIFVLPEDILINFSSSNVPNIYCSQPAWTESSKDYLREIMKNHPRDSKGRWMKINMAVKK
jgi:hypothetical protein